MKNKPKDGRNWEIVVEFLKQTTNTWHFYFCPEQKQGAMTKALTILKDGCTLISEGKTYWYPPSSILRVILQRKED